MVNNRIEKSIPTYILLNFKVSTVTTQQTTRTRVLLDMVTVPQAQNSLCSLWNPEIHLPCSKKSATYPYPGSD